MLPNRTFKVKNYPNLKKKSTNDLNLCAHFLTTSIFEALKIFQIDVQFLTARHYVNFSLSTMLILWLKSI